MQQKELQSITWTFHAEDPDNLHEPDLPAEVYEAIGFSKERRASYKNMMLDPFLPEGTEYTYGNRLRAYENVDQIQAIINKLKTDLSTRRACATTLYPPADLFSTSAPCMVLVQILSAADNTLNCFVTFRSHDLGKAALTNCYGLLHMLNFIAHETNCKPGTITIHSISAHVYESEWNNLQKLLDCQLWKSVRTNFDELQDQDPRGYVRIYVSDKITAELVTPQGEQLMTFESTLGREIAVKIARLNLLSRPDHYCYLARELCKAEIALNSGGRYIQDRSMEVDNKVVLR
jgi:thymidylate synthase